MSLWNWLVATRQESEVFDRFDKEETARERERDRGKVNWQFILFWVVYLLFIVTLIFSFATRHAQ